MTKIKYYESGKIEYLNPGEEKLANVMRELERLLLGINDTARLIVDDERIAEIKKKDALLEFELSSPQKITNPELGEYEFRKILIPLSGELSATEDENAVIIFLGMNNYDASPYINLEGKKTLTQILSALLRGGRKTM